MSTVIADILESEASAFRLESDLASWNARAEKAEAELAKAHKECAEAIRSRNSWVVAGQTKDKALEACRALVKRLDEALNGEDGILHVVIRDTVGSELNAAREALG